MKGKGRRVVRIKESEVGMVTGPSDRNLEELVAAASVAPSAEDDGNLAIRLLAGKRRS